MLLDWNTGLVKHLGIRFVETSKDRVVAELEIRPELLTTNGALHGGTLMAFADTIGAAGTVVNLGPGQNTQRSSPRPTSSPPRSRAWCARSRRRCTREGARTSGRRASPTTRASCYRLPSRPRSSSEVLAFHGSGV